MNSKQIIERLRELQYLLFSIARFNIVNVFGVKSFDQKLHYATEAYIAIYKANLIFDYLKYMYNQSDKKMGWDVENIKIDELVSLRGANINIAEKYILQYKEKILYVAHSLRSCKSENELMYEPALFLLSQLSLEWEGIVTRDNNINVVVRVSADIVKTATGPGSELLDEIFEPTYSLLDQRSVSFGDNIENNIEYFWNLSTREILAADLCGLSAIEYDYLPFEFYFDFITQMWDEARHACHYLHLTKKLLPEIYEVIKEPRMRTIIEDYLEKGILPIPKEKNFYEAMQNASLQERMILLNIRTEAPAVSRLTKKMESIFFKDYPNIQDAFRYDKNDEIRHGHIGAKWLKYLYPNVEERREVMANADTLRGFFVATALSMYSDKDYLTFLSEFKINFEWAESSAEKISH